jgi:hypothetical protein
MVMHKGVYSLLLCCSILLSLPSSAHHVLGRPAYSLNEDSNTPPSMAVETQIGDYFITYMIFPAFPKPGERGRINLYATRVDNGAIFNGEIAFSVRDDGWLTDDKNAESIGTQVIDDGVYRQGFVVNQRGSYIIRASFDANGEPYDVDFPLQIGNVSAMGPVGITVTLLLAILLGVNLLQRKRIARLKTREGNQKI